MHDIPRSVLLLGFADDFDTAAKSSAALVEAKLRRLIRTASSMGLSINEIKTKCMRTDTGDDCPVVVSFYRFDKVKEFSNLGSFVTSGNGPQR